MKLPHNKQQVVKLAETLISPRNLLKIGLLTSLIIVGNLLSNFLSELLNIELRPANEDRVHLIISLCALTYGALIAIPFVPGVEIGLGLIAMFGPPIVLLVYVVTIIGLSVSILVGHLIPNHTLVKLLRALQASRIADRIEEMASMTRKERLNFLQGMTSHQFARLALKNRYVLLAIAINLPGSFLIGGGGGISITAGVSRLFSIHGFIITIALAVSPIPLSVALFGMAI